MTGRPAARLTDMTAHGGPLAPGPGSPNILIGGLPAWRGIGAAQVAALLDTFQQGVKDIGKATAKATAAAGTPAGPAAQLHLEETIKDSALKVARLIASFTADIHACATPYVVIPHGTGVVIDGSQTVFHNNLPACRLGDTIQETLSVNKIVMGCFTVLIGG
ncbi:PAAR domain-containing protein [Gloeobacter kilaueensis]|uniref:Uncharacterized protein n=1 Tax=Gloeobacter kilaueensis (strain ATCC BAA-2537 / CCAP 1431/1 / ULC 316 / JS1) TaxID=1183438 RepID=U5QC17_GLOK1|nr:PAAR domain-containing protein [Gloeobacter kilaueensis]AGY56447.1 hypothetical protein GKIL_0200 [Gloeobacter kilaueensis JS1]